PYDWLTRDGEIVDKYNADPACGFTFTAAGYADLFNLIGYISSESWYKLVPKSLPILLVAGAEDPVGAYGAGPAEVAEGLENAGCKDVSLILYEGMRHEILNEFGKEAVYEDLKRFILGEEALGADEEEDEPAEAEAADIAEKKHFDADPEDRRPAAEKAMDDAAQLDHSSPDISGVEKADVPHKGIRGFGSEFSEEPAEDTGSNDGELKLKAALKDLMEEPALEVDAPAQDNRPANEKAMDAASDYPDSPDLSGVDKQDVPHRGIRNVYETVDGLAEGAAEAAETVKEEVRKISEQAEDLAAKYNG
ncbi:MAG: alpha/beta hydrolase, partial [Firmicutes bacterium]|nr:alpha/beta hydrolase [Bacillota bacterium]